MKIVLVTGMSGAGKSVALKTLEDCGFEAIDNLPLSFLPALANTTSERPLAVGVDIRSRDFSAEALLKATEPISHTLGQDFKIVFFDCDDEVLRRRFTETRRRHPLALDRTVMDGISHERRLIERLRDRADLVIDTSSTQAAELKQVVASHFAREERGLSIVVTSFSFKRGVPRDADMVFDVRFLKNPYYDPLLKSKTGQDALVGAYIESDEAFTGFFERLTGFVEPLLPRYLAEGKTYLTIAIGCTGGRHRSVFVTNKLAAQLTQSGYKTSKRHRDLEKAT